MKVTQNTETQTRVTEVNSDKFTVEMSLEELAFIRLLVGGAIIGSGLRNTLNDPIYMSIPLPSPDIGLFNELAPGYSVINFSKDSNTHPLWQKHIEKCRKHLNVGEPA